MYFDLGFVLRLSRLQIDLVSSLPPLGSKECLTRTIYHRGLGLGVMDLGEYRRRCRKNSIRGYLPSPYNQMTKCKRLGPDEGVNVRNTFLVALLSHCSRDVHCTCQHGWELFLNEDNDSIISRPKTKVKMSFLIHAVCGSLCVLRFLCFSSFSVKYHTRGRKAF